MHEHESILHWSNGDRPLTAEAPELPGCMAHGDDQETTLWNIKGSMQFQIERTREPGQPLPDPKGERLMFV